MREIKFRQWDCRYKKMIVGAEIVSDGHFRGFSLLNFNENVPMQYTGLNDKNGKEIYEGDIVETNSIKWTEPLEVKFVDGAFCVGKKDIGVSDFGDWVTIRDGMAQAQLKDLELEIKVIGNIHENKELLQ